jgi:hypothetical protein
MAMPEGGEGLGWDFLTVVTAWSLYALPALLVAVGLMIFFKKGLLRTTDPQKLARDGRRIVRILVLIHLCLGAHGAILFVQELLTMRVMGVTQSFPNFVLEALAVVVNPLVALGLFFARPWARRAAIAWYLLLSTIGFFVAWWLWHHHVPFKAWSWPDHLAGKVMPVFLLVVMFLPRVKRVFARPTAATAPADEQEAKKSNTARTESWSVTALFAVLFLIVVVSNFAVSSAEWLDRSLAEWNESE